MSSSVNDATLQFSMTRSTLMEPGSALATHPADGHLCGRHALALGNLCHRLDKLEVLVEDVGLEARQHAAEVVLWEVVELAELARQPAAADGAVCHDGNANCVCVDHAVSR